MTPGPDLPLPTARSLQGWWRELANLRPRRLWFGRLLLHHLDAFVKTAHTVALDPLQRALLRVSAAGTALPGFDPQIQARIRNELALFGLLEAEGGLTPAGRAALESATFTLTSRERRSFWFVDNAACGKPPFFLAPQRPLEPTDAPDGWTFPTAMLDECVRQPAEWKQEHHFPADILAIVDLAAAPDDWNAIPIDRAEKFFGVMVETENATLSAYAVRPDSWGLEREPPAFTLGKGWEDVLADLIVEPAPEEWRKVWFSWCQAHGIVESDAGGCTLERAGHRLTVRMPKKLAERLRTARGEPLKNEAWLLAPTGRLHLAAQLDVVEQESLG